MNGATEIPINSGNPVSILADFNSDNKINQVDYVLLSDIIMSIWQNAATVQIITEPLNTIITRQIRIYADDNCTIEIIPDKMPFYFGKMYRSQSTTFKLWVKNVTTVDKIVTLSVIGPMTNYGTSVFNPVSIALAPGNVRQVIWTFTVKLDASYDNATGALILNAN